MVDPAPFVFSEDWATPSTSLGVAGRTQDEN